MADQSKYTSKLQGKHVLVIGGSGGIGYGVAEASVEFGATVFISSSNPSRVKDSVASLEKSYPSSKGKITGEVCDIGNEETLERNIVTLLDRVTSNGKLDHIIWTAADHLAVMKVADLDMSKIRKAGVTRFYGPLMLAKHARTYMNPGRESSITLTTGAVSERPMPDWTLINSYATGLQGMTRGLALDLKPMRVNLVSPGAVDTTLWEGMGADSKKNMFEKIEATLPTGKIASAMDVAESYLYLMKDFNITGSMISTNGGTLLTGPRWDL